MFTSTYFGICVTGPTRFDSLLVRYGQMVWLVIPCVVDQLGFCGRSIGRCTLRWDCVIVDR